ncbi:o-succinylbenzoate synthase [Dokdonia pacifica]|uniref:o-succinylbenzoate synthase n=1 Tax=Dokdonia pacifica TaxID=1627892 RepID=A0A238ZD82_9FLAO|nr:o-succinylbenzoate synthase [Dokdonia pacifica]GGG05588.1 o-succinylbenzoate synthase [Dokdonia pacifica]SNR81032.1 o-succinylbenzoate synthase [Dokdonia pacifica]
MKATYHKHILKFKRASGTSRGILKTKETWYIVIKDGNKTGIGECGILRGLSFDDRPDYEERLRWTCANIQKGPEMLWEELKEFPSIQFGVEMAFLSLEAQDPFVLFPSEFTQHKDAIAINGLVWMGDEVFMKEQIEQKLEAGFDCIKMKIGAIDFDKELALLRFIRKHYDASKITVRVDANGGFAFAKAREVLKELATLEIHSIEQPIAVGQWEEMKRLCEETPTPIALDEELIGVMDVIKKRELLQIIRPQYIILKPSFVGGYQGSEEWIDQAEALGIGWWITSALESNIGLNAIAQWTYDLKAKGPQGLGTGSLFTNNIQAPLEVRKGALHYNNQLDWDFNTDTLCL